MFMASLPLNWLLKLTWDGRGTYPAMIRINPSQISLGALSREAAADQAGTASPFG
jgi:hypothetical protein